MRKLIYLLKRLGPKYAALFAIVCLSLAVGCAGRLALDPTLTNQGRQETSPTGPIIMLPTERESTQRPLPKPTSTEATAAASLTPTLVSPTAPGTSTSLGDMQGFLQLPSGIGDAGNYFMYAGREVFVDWLRVNTYSAQSMSGENDKQVEGWIDDQEGFYEFGPCDQVPLVSDS